MVIFELAIMILYKGIYATNINPISLKMAIQHKQNSYCFFNQHEGNLSWKRGWTNEAIRILSFHFSADKNASFVLTFCQQLFGHLTINVIINAIMNMIMISHLLSRRHHHSPLDRIKWVRANTRSDRYCPSKDRCHDYHFDREFRMIMNMINWSSASSLWPDDNLIITRWQFTDEESLPQ